MRERELQQITPCEPSKKVRFLARDRLRRALDTAPGDATLAELRLPSPAMHLLTIAFAVLGTPFLIGCSGGGGSPADPQPSTGTAAAPETLRFNGACDASAACALDARRVVVADDENNILRLYDLDAPGMPLAEFPMGRFLKTNTDSHPEADLEACARVGDRIYWLASHGRSKKGKWRPNRYLFFATRVVEDKTAPGGWRIEPAGSPCRTLLASLLATPGLDLGRTVGKLGSDEAGSLAPKEEGLNIEGLAPGADGESLLIGFRNPRPGGDALLLPLLNATAVIDSGAPARFGEPIRLDLGGRGVRSIEHSPAHGGYFIAAGSHENARISALYRWSGRAADKAERLRGFDDFNPEAIAPLPGGKRLAIFSDDGTVKYRVPPEQSTEPLEDGECECKTLRDPRMKAFRAEIVEFD